MRLSANIGWYKEHRSQNQLKNSLPFTALLFSFQVLEVIIIIAVPSVPSVHEQRVIPIHCQRWPFTNDLTTIRHTKCGRHKETLLPLYTWATMAEGCQIIYSWIRSLDINASACHLIVPLQRKVHMVFLNPCTNLESHQSA